MINVYSQIKELRNLSNFSEVLTIILTVDGKDACIEEICKSLINGGCTNYVCFGANSEVVHDFIDDHLIEAGSFGITTWHVNEPEEDVSSLIEVLPEFSNCSQIILVAPVELNQSTKTSILQFKRLLSR